MPRSSSCWGAVRDEVLRFWMSSQPMIAPVPLVPAAGSPAPDSPAGRGDAVCRKQRRSAARPRRWRTKAVITLAIALAVALLSVMLPPHGIAQNQSQPEALFDQSQLENRIDGFPVVMDGHTILSIRQGISGFSAQERALTITRRLKRLAKNESISVGDLTIQRNADDNSIFLGVGHEVLLTITERDAQANRTTPDALASQALRDIKAAISRYRQDREPEYLVRGTVYATIASSAFLLISFLLISITGKLFPVVARWITSRAPGIRVNNVEIISSSAISAFWLQILKFLRLALLLVLLFSCITWILRLFPWTRAVGESVLSYAGESLELALSATANYLPNLFVVTIILSMAYYGVRMVKPFFLAIERGNLVIPGFYPDWAQPTYNLLSVLVIALAAILAFPYLPGFNSPAFQGISVFIGLLLSLGSTSAITNVIGGIILIYTRAFRMGDHIRVGDVVGDIIEKNFLAVRICTPSNQIITIPNATLLSNKVVNYNIAARELGTDLILQTTVTLGYEVPWRQVHDTLIKAAISTEHVRSEPAPFVLQTSLDNNYISYQLNAYTDTPNTMVFIYSKLHQSIQDGCRENGIEILSPTYTALRDGSASTIPGSASGPPPAVAAPFRAGDSDQSPGQG